MPVTITITVSTETGATEVSTGEAGALAATTGDESGADVPAPLSGPGAGEASEAALEAGPPAVPLELEELGVSAAVGATIDQGASEPEELEASAEADASDQDAEPRPIEDLEAEA